MLTRKRLTLFAIAKPPAGLYTSSLPKAWVGAFIIGSVVMNEERSPSPRPRCRRLTGVRVLATGSYVPEAVLTNEHLHARFGFDSDWIVKRTGIRERRHALPHQATSDLCYLAARRCIEQAGVKTSDIDCLILATFTP